MQGRRAAQRGVSSLPVSGSVAHDVAGVRWSIWARRRDKEERHVERDKEEGDAGRGGSRTATCCIGRHVLAAAVLAWLQGRGRAATMYRRGCRWWLSVFYNNKKSKKSWRIPLDPPRHRFQVPDVVLPDFLSKKLWLQRLTPEDGGSSSAVYLSDEHDAVLRHNPFEVFVRRRSTNRPVLSLNSHRLFDYEPLWKKEEGDDWEERFRGHTEFVTGIPEHAMSLALKPTQGPGLDHSEPYQLFNLDVFEYLSESPFGLYGSIPLMISHGKAGNSAGFFWLNATEMQIDVLGKGWDSETGAASSILASATATLQALFLWLFIILAFYGYGDSLLLLLEAIRGKLIGRHNCKRIGKSSSCSIQRRRSSILLAQTTTHCVCFV
ncbi:hypothetical protein Tsubulata_019019 [Turnera subulata]|uniref:Glycoside hydrolase family 31 N-terminal domain-containing protein n=1 Tax=Turnera subulata TaxID=218843 RepID=A0A9Q0JFB6_9ROSI|nr:hypothetical protein Tsubulata_019019 [Turnera subulata]